MDRKATIRTLREIIRNLKDDYLFEDSDFEDEIDKYLPDCKQMSKVKKYIFKRLQL